MENTKAYTSQNTSFEAILESISEGVFTVDLQFCITYFNKAAETITGISKKNAIGQRCSDIFRSSLCADSCAYNTPQKLDKAI